MAHDGNRAAGTAGYEKSVQYVVSELQKTDFMVTTQEFQFSYWTLLAPISFTQTAPVVVKFVEGVDFLPFQGSNGSVVQASVFGVAELGCNPQDFTGMQAGQVAIILRGNCTFELKASLSRSLIAWLRSLASLSLAGRQRSCGKGGRCDRQKLYRWRRRVWRPHQLGEYPRPAFVSLANASAHLTIAL